MLHIHLDSKVHFAMDQFQLVQPLSLYKLGRIFGNEIITSYLPGWHTWMSFLQVKLYYDSEFESFWDRSTPHSDGIL